MVVQSKFLFLLAFVVWFCATNKYLPLIPLFMTYLLECRSIWRGEWSEKLDKSRDWVSHRISVGVCFHRNGTCSTRYGSNQVLSSRLNRLAYLSIESGKQKRLPVPSFFRLGRGNSTRQEA